MAPIPAPSVLAGLKQALKAHEPFVAMDEGNLDRLVRASTLRYYASGESVIAPGPDRPAHCYAIRQGTIRGERPGAGGEATMLWELSAGEMFPLAALLAHRGVTSRYRATEDTFCLVFPAAAFDGLIRTSPVFADFCTRRLEFLLDLSRARLQSEYAAAITEQRGLATPLGGLSRNAPVVCGPQTSLADALATMEAHRIGALPIVDADTRPIGIFTRQDVIARIVLPQRPLTLPIRDVMSTPVITLPASATAGDAALVMAGSGIRHVVIRDDDG
ncbi:MAG: CBS domain-containing protein, partial [Betaproteobacteria bacterium]